MKKSEQYTFALYSVLCNAQINDDDKLEVLETLFEDRRVAKFGEDRGNAES